MIELLFSTLITTSTPSFALLDAGKAAPFSGVLYTPEANAKLLARLERLRKEKALEIDVCAEEKPLEAQEGAVNALLEQPEETSPIIFIGIGIVGGVLLSAGAVWAVSKAQNP